MAITVEQNTFGKLKDGSEVKLYRVSNKNGMCVELLNYGATIRSIILTDSAGKSTDVCLGFDKIDGYFGKYFGCVVGRVANRIALGKFQVDGIEYELAKNNGPNSLHGGLKGFDKKIWNAIPEKDGVCFTYLSKDGEEGYPGDVLVNARYRLTNENALELSFLATTTKATPINLANHCFFNLAGHESGAENGLYDHEICINADCYTPVSETLIPTGEIAPVASNSIFDLRISKRLGDMLPHCPGGQNNGYDHNFCVNGNFVKNSGHSDMRFVGVVLHTKSGRKLECYSNQLGVQFYTGNFIPKDGSVKGKEGATYSKHGGFCLETQAYPDSVNQKSFPCDSILRPGKVYDHRVVYKFLDL